MLVYLPGEAYFMFECINQCPGCPKRAGGIRSRTWSASQLCSLIADTQQRAQMCFSSWTHMLPDQQLGHKHCWIIPLGTCGKMGLERNLCTSCTRLVPSQVYLQWRRFPWNVVPELHCYLDISLPEHVVGALWATLTRRVCYTHPRVRSWLNRNHKRTSPSTSTTLSSAWLDSQDCVFWGRNKRSFLFWILAVLKWSRSNPERDW